MATLEVSRWSRLWDNFLLRSGPVWVGLTGEAPEAPEAGDMEGQADDKSDD